MRTNDDQHSLISNDGGSFSDAMEMQQLGGDQSLDHESEHHEADPEVIAAWLSPWAPQNRAMMASYFTIGFYSGFYVGPLQYYLSHTIDASPESQAIVSALVQLPWSFKLFCGFLSDALPIRGQRRKPYFIIGWLTFCACNLLLCMMDKPSVTAVALFMFMSTWSFILADVCTDAVFVERSKMFERAGSQGKLQSAGYTLRFFGTVIGALISVWMNQPMWLVFAIQAAIPLICITPFINQFHDINVNDTSADSDSQYQHHRSLAHPSIREQLQSIWLLVQRRAVWYPSCFVFIYNSLQLSNPAWNNFLESQLHFEASDFSYINLAGAILSFVSLMVYTKYLDKVSWRSIYVFTTMIVLVFSVLQLVLLFDLIPQRSMQFWFSMGDQAVSQFVISIQFLPMVKMFVLMCPEGAEGSSYAMLTTMSNLAMAVASALASLVSKAFDVSKTALNAHDYSGMWKLTIVCAVAQGISMLFIPILPSGVEEQAEMADKDESNETAGKVFIFVLTSALMLVLISSIVTLSSA